MKDTRGYIYFAIKTDDEDFNLESFDRYLTIRPTKFRKKYQEGKTPVCTSWEYGSGDLVNPDYFNEIETLISELTKHKPELISLRAENPQVSYVLEIVMFLGDESPGLHFSEKTIGFLNDIGGVIDCDMYNDKP